MPDDEEKLQLRLDVERFKRMIKTKDEMIEEMEHELAKFTKMNMSDLGISERERELREKLCEFQNECDAKTAQLVEKDAEIELLKKEVNRLEISNRELVDRMDQTTLDVNETANSFSEEELLKMSAEMEIYKHELVKLHEENAGLRKELIGMKENYENTLAHVSSLENHIKGRNEEIEKLEGELFDLRNRGEHAAKGNSIFAEAMEAEQKLEEDLRTVYKEKLMLQRMMKRLQMEKEDAEHRARTALNRAVVARETISEADFNEMKGLRDKIRDLEQEKTHLWEKLFIKLKSAPKKDTNPIIMSFFDGFKCSIESMKTSQNTTAKQLEQLIVKHSILKLSEEQLKRENENLRAEIEALKYKLSQNRNGEKSTKPFTPKPPVPVYKPSFFSKAVVSKEAGIEKPMANVTLNSSRREPKENDENVDVGKTPMAAERRRQAILERNLKPTVQYNYVTLTNAADAVQGFKPPLLTSTPKKSEP
ncbi:unnamed protein product [Caenorhabditis bovis]|uniref:Uncharacterized protein n=1 Tax=Caenorhabditis bovis TaxID=2654633 RepID=A0A8S1FA03_9PELO|nr:unnamed protein product [Caenorhabditis bovis]